ncbi:MAG TPA: hypothetical protein VJ499_04910 [Flavisolibacter sp.]|nr:hypothetical protein [Sediminibacterium sp.]HJW16434.1 hypothetical protein [Flavisolibacter sp.]
MKFIPILFSTPIVEAILVGRKTQTRRIVKPQPTKQEAVEIFCKEGPGSVSASDLTQADIEIDELFEKCPYGKVGDVIWVRETWRKYYNVDENGNTDFDKEIIEYAADNPPMIPEMDGDGFQVFNKDGSEKFISWKPSLFMPKEACRIFLKITNVRVERLQDISDKDAIAEGVRSRLPDNGIAKQQFFDVWTIINGYENLMLNPWVWVIEFERVELTEEQKHKFLTN